MSVVSVVCCAAGVLCVEPITRPEEFYRVWCVIEYDIETSRMRKSSPTGGCCAEIKKWRHSQYFLLWIL